ncbi:3-hydroxy-3-methylglutaryl-coenzyme A reductase 2 [Thelohanellus kitauei]|uniref:3-hydroxy-3-methylglutaryl-coenzyme A reductase n=1 Tax=Thelohanellus kitauei TaxID=669202 RepID=A0A0C2MCX4_THEKT|nr:3-hydroxy-3-methylglutaryl-coenzyme A reductase 2 [Thelohanellus kitauei]
MRRGSFDCESDGEIIESLHREEIKPYMLENYLEAERCVRIRRQYYKKHQNVDISDNLSFKEFDYKRIVKRNCENVVGFVSIPVGIVGPIRINSFDYWVPLATTEGCLVASTNRGARCVFEEGITGIVLDDSMTRAPVLKVDSLHTAQQIKSWISKIENFQKVTDVFEATSKYLKLIEIKPMISGRFVFLRYKARCGEAMGMNMVSKLILDAFPGQAQLLSVSGNLCTDKKASALNWIEGRGKSVVCESLIPSDVIESKLHVTAEQLVELNICKNMVGSATACTIGGNNANAANIDIAQVVESSQCLTFLEMQGDYLYISCTMPSLEVGTVGGGTHLQSQNACLNMMKLERDKSLTSASNLAIVICSAVLCCELSLLAALSADTLVSSHMKFNRSNTSLSCETI